MLKVKIIFKLDDKIKTYYHYHAWMTTILKILQTEHEAKSSNICLLFVCSTPSHYT